MSCCGPKAGSTETVKGKGKKDKKSKSKDGSSDVYQFSNSYDPTVPSDVNNKYYSCINNLQKYEPNTFMKMCKADVHVGIPSQRSPFMHDRKFLANHSVKGSYDTHGKVNTTFVPDHLGHISGNFSKISHHGHYNKHELPDMRFDWRPPGGLSRQLSRSLPNLPSNSTLHNREDPGGSASSGFLDDQDVYLGRGHKNRLSQGYSWDQTTSNMDHLTRLKQGCKRNTSLPNVIVHDVTGTNLTEEEKQALKKAMKMNLKSPEGHFFSSSSAHHAHHEKTSNGRTKHEPKKAKNPSVVHTSRQIIHRSQSAHKKQTGTAVATRNITYSAKGPVAGVHQHLSNGSMNSGCDGFRRPKKTAVHGSKVKRHTSISSLCSSHSTRSRRGERKHARLLSKGLDESLLSFSGECHTQSSDFQNHSNNVLWQDFPMARFNESPVHYCSTSTSFNNSTDLDTVHPQMNFPVSHHVIHAAYKHQAMRRKQTFHPKYGYTINQSMTDANVTTLQVPDSFLASRSKNISATSQRSRESVMSAGKTVLKYGKKNHPSIREPGYFCYPKSTCVLPSGDMVVLDTENLTLQIVSREGFHKGIYHFQVDVIDIAVWDRAIVILRSDAVVILDLGRQTMRKLRISNIYNASSIALVRYSNNPYPCIAIGMTTVVNIFKIDGTLVGTLTSHNFPKAVEGFRNIVNVSHNTRNDDILLLDQDTGNIHVFTFQGKHRITIDPSQFSDIGCLKSPHGMCVDGVGNILVADTLNHRVVQFSRNGGFCLQAFLPGYYPNDVASLEAGLMVVAVNSYGRSFAGIRVYQYD